MAHPISLFAAATLPADAVEIGRIAGPWGVKGWVRLHPYSADTSALFASECWFLLPPEEPYGRGFAAFQGSVSVQVAQIKPHADGVVAQLQGVDDRAQAEALKGVRLLVPRSAFPEAPHGEYYWVDLIGMAVVNRDGQAMGVVRDLLPTGPHAVLVLEYLDTAGDVAEKIAERMIPFVDAYVDHVDLLGRRITVDWGLDY